MIPGLPVAEVARHYRRAVMISLGLGAATLVVAAVLGHAGIGVLVFIGLGLGATNGALAQISSARYAAQPKPDRRRFAMGAFARLMVISVIAFFFVLAFRPEGLAVLFGIAAFQLLLIGTSTVAMLRLLRKSGTAA